MPKPTIRSDITLSTTLIALACAFLTIKDFQEVQGIRVVSILIPMLLLILHIRKANSLKIPRVVIFYFIYGCVLLPFVSIYTQGFVSLYVAYLVTTIVCAYIIIAVSYYSLGKGMEWIGNIYTKAIAVVCVFSYLTLEHQWFGGYSIRSFSDFSTFFALQVSVAIPYLKGKFRDPLRIFFLLTLFMTFSRVSFFLSFAVVIFQIFKERKSAAIFIFPVFIGVLAVLLSSTIIGNMMLHKMSNLVAFADVGAPVSSLDASDIGRVAYMSVTLDSLSDVKLILFGHGIKTNSNIIDQNLDISKWGLGESMAHATVHNVYIELLSDTGLFGLFLFLATLTYIGLYIYKYRGWQSKYFLSFLIFVISYMFEANYVSFFFQFFVMYFLFVAFDGKKGVAHV